MKPVSKIAREPVEQTHIEKAIGLLRLNIVKAIEKHGNDSYYNRHEIIGSLKEEFDEVCHAKKPKTEEKTILFVRELLDVATVALWAVAGIVDDADSASKVIGEPEEEKGFRQLDWIDELDEINNNSSYWAASSKKGTDGSLLYWDVSPQGIGNKLFWTFVDSSPELTKGYARVDWETPEASKHFCQSLENDILRSSSH